MYSCYSPLRYPGEKSALLPLFKKIVSYDYDLWIEPFAGGASVGLGLLCNNHVKKIILNDFDIAIFSFWRTLFFFPEYLLNKINTTPLTIEEWYKQKTIYDKEIKKDCFSKELGFATLFLNLTNEFGVLNSEPIGGYNQQGNYKLNAYYHKKTLTDKIIFLSNYKDRVILSNLDFPLFIKNLQLQKTKKTFLYIDPPSYNGGSELYNKCFEDKEHILLKNIIQTIRYDWVITYDNDDFIQELYKYHHFVSSCVFNKLNNREDSLIIFSNTDLLKRSL